MLKCSTCQAEQDAGKFCGVCGGQLEEIKVEEGDGANLEQQAATTEPISVAVEPDAIQATPEPVATQQNAVDIKDELTQYGNYLLDLLKNPTKGLKFNESHFLHGIINVSLYAITFALSIYFLFNSLFKSTFGLVGGMMGDIFGSNTPSSLPFFSLFFKAGIRGVILVAIAFISILIFSKIITNTINMKEIIAQYGGIITPLIALNFLAMLLGLLGSPGFSSSLIFLSLILTIVITPALMILDLSKDQTVPTQKIYFSLGASTVSLIGLYFVIKNSFSSLFGGLQDIMGFLDFL